MEISTELPQHVTPCVDKLMPNQFDCEQPNCTSKFTNRSQYDLHCYKHHKIILPQRADDNCLLFHCPMDTCVYNVQRGVAAKHFKKLKYLRQHYQKVHADKTHICPNCSVGFVTNGLLQSHAKVCGHKFSCVTCGWEYGSMEALLTHGKRKGHVVREAAVNVAANTVRIPHLPRKTTQKRPPKRQSQHQRHQHTQTEYLELPLAAAIPVAVCEQTADVDTQFSNSLDEIPDVNDIETQVKFPACRSPRSPNPRHDVYIDHMLGSGGGHLAHTHTQTDCDELLSELGLSADMRRTTSGAHDELLVSTETQTSFTQCLLDSDADHADASPFASLSQYTQTCETLLEGFLESDFIAGLQSTTYTQTS